MAARCLLAAGRLASAPTLARCSRSFPPMGSRGLTVSAMAFRTTRSTLTQVGLTGTRRFASVAPIARSPFSLGPLGYTLAAAVPVAIYAGTRMYQTSAMPVPVVIEEPEPPLLEIKLAPTAAEEKRSFFARLMYNAWLLIRGSFMMCMGTAVATSGAIVFHLPTPEFVRTAWTESLIWLLCRMGPCMIKLGQWAATRPDLFPQDLCDRLSHLHTNVPTHSFRHTQELIIEAFGLPVEELFAEFNKEPLASGAIAQVHIAVTHEGQKVAVKVRHPAVSHVIAQDLRIIKTLTKWLEMLPGVQWMNLEQATATFMRSMMNQVNLEKEAENLRVFWKNFNDFPNVCFPKPDDKLCSQAVIVESFEEGVHISEFLDHRKASEDVVLKRQLATLGFTSYLKMIFVDNLIHADLHPGNILVRELRPGVPEVVILDVGLVTRLRAVDRQNFLDLFSAVAAGNGAKAAEMMIARARDQPVPPTPEMAAYFQVEVHKLFDEITSKPLSEITMAPYFVRMMGLCRQCHVKIESNFTTLVSGLIVVEGLARQLNADFDLFAEARPLLALDPSLMNTYLRDKLGAIWK